MFDLKKICASCEREIPEKARFCPYCGADLRPYEERKEEYHESGFPWDEYGIEESNEDEAMDDLFARGQRMQDFGAYEDIRLRGEQENENHKGKTLTDEVQIKEELSPESGVLKKCPGCGKIVNVQLKSKFCPNCKSKLLTNIVICPNCGEENLADDKVCCSCGTSLRLSYTGKDLQWEVTWNEKEISKNQPEGKQAEKEYSGEQRKEKDRESSYEDQALSAAKDMLKRGYGYSYLQLVEKLMDGDFNVKEAKYAADHCGADWNVQAFLAAKRYVEFAPDYFDREEIIDWLTEYDHFTETEAEYASERFGLSSSDGNLSSELEVLKRNAAGLEKGKKQGISGALRKCPGCGQVVKSKGNFCPVCGSRLDMKFVVCPNCMMVNQAGNEVCSACGALLKNFYPGQNLSAAGVENGKFFSKSQPQRKMVCFFRYDEKIYNEYLYLMARLALEKCNVDIRDYDLLIEQQGHVWEFFEEHGVDMNERDIYKASSGLGFEERYDKGLENFLFLRGEGVHDSRFFLQQVKFGKEGIHLYYGIKQKAWSSRTIPWNNFEFGINTSELIIVCQQVPENIMGKAVTSKLVSNKKIYDSITAHWYRLDPLIQRSVQVDDVIIPKDRIKGMSSDDLMEEIRRHVEKIYDWQTETKEKKSVSRQAGTGHPEEYGEKTRGKEDSGGKFYPDNLILRKCPNCGKIVKVKTNSKICPYCGSRLNLRSFVCPSCMKQNWAGDKACRYCGASLQPSYSEQDLLENNVYSENLILRKCPNCGKTVRVKKNSKICPYCHWNLYQAVTFCPNCKRPNMAENTDCEYCGAYLYPYYSIKDGEPEPDRDLQRASIKEKYRLLRMPICFECGEQIPEYAKFCPCCGAAQSVKVPDSCGAAQSVNVSDADCEFLYDENIYNEYLYLIARLALSKCSLDIKDFNLWIKTQGHVWEFFEEHGVDMNKRDIYKEQFEGYTGEYFRSYLFLRGEGVHDSRYFFQRIWVKNGGIAFSYGPNTNLMKKSEIILWDQFECIINTKKLIIVCRNVPGKIMGKATKSARLTNSHGSKKTWYKMDPLIERSKKKKDFVISKDGIQGMSSENLLEELRSHIKTFYDWEEV